jgi:3-dehydroquinate synthase
MNIILYGPPGSGKSSVGQALAERLGREFVDVDARIEAETGLTIPDLFAQRGEAEFRRIESAVCAALAARSRLIIAPGGGALLEAANRAALERTGLLICLRADAATLLDRLQASAVPRPLLAGPDPLARLNALLNARRPVYDSFVEQIDTTSQSIPQVVERVLALLEPRTLPVNAPGFQHEIALGYGLLEALLPTLEARGLSGPKVIVTDENLAPRLPTALRHLPWAVLPAGEAYKTLDSIQALFQAFLKHGLDRKGLVIAVGGGVIGDMAGFAAATYMRGVRWVNVPTTLLAMVDASLGGKTGVDLPQGKNLVGAFYPPALVASDPLVLKTLPAREIISGMAEVVKHGVIADPALFEVLEAGAAFGGLEQIRRAIDVKVRVVEADPLEKGQRATLNLGHTVGHGVEAASGYQLRHGESIAIGLAAEAQIAEQMGLAERGLAERIARVLERVGLPTRCPGLDPAAIRAAMSSDKKKAGGKLKFALPKRVGEVSWGIEVDEPLLMATLKAITAD